MTPVTFANPVVSRILGLGAETVLGRNYLDFVRQDYQEAGIALYRRQIKELIPVTYWEFPAVTGDGREVWIGQKVHVETEGRWVVGLFAVARDITIDQGHLLLGRELCGVIEGDSNPQDFIPALARHFADGEFPFDKLVKTYKLEQINEAFEAAHNGSVVKPILVFD